MTSQHDHDIERADAELPGRDDIADDERLDDDLADDELLDDDPLNDNVIVAEGVEAGPGEAAPAASSPGGSIARPAAASADTGPAARPTANGPGGENALFSAERLSQEWREIQATFVDDPRGAVQLAAEAADSALTALMTSLREHHAVIGPSATQDTEQLREALQEYRKFCQGLAETGRRFAVG